MSAHKVFSLDTRLSSKFMFAWIVIRKSVDLIAVGDKNSKVFCRLSEQ